MRINLYGQTRHLIIVDGVPLSGFKEGDHIQIKLDGNAATRTHGGDGPSMNLSAPQGGQITLGLNPTSPAIGTLYTIRQQQARNPRLFSIQVVTGVEEFISAGGCAFGEHACVVLFWQAGHDHDWNVGGGGVRLERAEYGESAEPWHENVEDDQVRFVLLNES